jgi:hypothetical protein
MKTIILQTLEPVTKHLGNLTNQPPLLSRLFLIPLMLVCCALCPIAQAVEPAAADTALAGGNTADGQLALSGLTTGIYNSAFGIYALLSNADANFNTGVGAGVLLANTANENTATGAGTLFSTTIGNQNTANGAFALFNNIEGIRNTAIGARALFNNTGDSNTAIGAEALGVKTAGNFNVAIGGSALIGNSTGASNTAIGVGALSQATGDGNTVLGRVAGFGITTGNNIIAIGQLSGASTTNGQVDDSCYIDNIFGAGVDAGTAVLVFVDQDGKLGTTALPNTGALSGAQSQAMLNELGKEQKRVAGLEGTVARLAAAVKEQAAQIQKVSAQLDVNKPAAQVASNKQ